MLIHSLVLLISRYFQVLTLYRISAFLKKNIFKFTNLRVPESVYPCYYNQLERIHSYNKLSKKRPRKPLVCVVVGVWDTRLVSSRCRRVWKEELPVGSSQEQSSRRLCCVNKHVCRIHETRLFFFNSKNAVFVLNQDERSRHDVRRRCSILDVLLQSANDCKYYSKDWIETFYQSCKNIFPLKNKQTSDA